MLGNAEVLTALQAALPLEAQLNEQYRADWRSLKFIGVKKLAKVIHEFGDDAACWRRKVQDRILFLGGDISVTIPVVVEARGVADCLRAELKLELAIVAPYEQSVQTAMQALDDTTRNLFEHLLKWHEKHVGWLEQQLRLIEALGQNDYIAEKLG